MKAIWLETRERKRREEQEQRDSWTLWSKDFEERNDVMKVGREYWPAGWCLQKGRPSAIAISLEGSVEKYKAFIITLLVSFRFNSFWSAIVALVIYHLNGGNSYRTMTPSSPIAKKTFVCGQLTALAIAIAIAIAIALDVPWNKPQTIDFRSRQDHKSGALKQQTQP